MTSLTTAAVAEQIDPKKEPEAEPPACKTPSPRSEAQVIRSESPPADSPIRLNTMPYPPQVLGDHGSRRADINNAPSHRSRPCSPIYVLVRRNSQVS
jgi:hypothetical protein